MRVQSKPQVVTRLFPVGNFTGYQRRASNDKPLDKFLGRLRASYNYVFRPPANTGNIDKIQAKNSDSVPQILRVIWPDQTKYENYTDLKYPNNSLVDQVRSLFGVGDDENKTNSGSIINKDFYDSVEIKSTINTMKKSSNNTRTLDDTDWFDDIDPLEQLELQDDELNTKKKIDNKTPGTTIKFPTVVGQNLIEWFGSILSNAYRVYTKLSNTACGKAIK